MEWILCIALVAICVCSCWTIYENMHAVHKPEPEETKHSCCYNCPDWFEDAVFANCKRSGICTKKSTVTVKIPCYTAWDYVCDDYSGNAPEEEKHE